MTVSDFIWRAADAQHPGVTCEARFDNVASEYIVLARRDSDGRTMTERFKAKYPSSAGVDYYDFLNIRLIAGKLADELAIQGAPA